MSKPEDDIQRKLDELELSLKSEENVKKIKAAEENKDYALSHTSNTNLTTVNDDNLGSDLYMLGGFASLIVGILMIFSNIRMGTGWMTWLGLGQHGMGFLILPVLIGAGMIFYNYKSRLAWGVTAVGCVLILFTLLSQLVMTFPSVSLLGLIVMFLPLVIGIVLLVRGIQSKKSTHK